MKVGDYYLLNTTTTNGMENMKLVADHISSNNKSWNNFPALSWVYNKNGVGIYVLQFNNSMRLGCVKGELNSSRAVAKF